MLYFERQFSYKTKIFQQAKFRGFALPVPTAVVMVTQDNRLLALTTKN